MEENLRKKAEKIKLFITDVDGVLTDGSIFLGNDGEELKAFHVHDGKGIILAQRAGLQVAIITGRSSRIVERRARELNIKDVYQDIQDKIKVFNQLLVRYNLKPEEVAYIGDDINDLEVLQTAGLSFSVKNGMETVKKMVDYVTVKEGGKGAVREALEIIMEAQNQFRGERELND